MRIRERGRRGGYGKKQQEEGKMKVEWMCEGRKCIERGGNEWARGKEIDSQ